MPLKATEIKNIPRQVVRWFRANARDLPWRRTRDPYAVWISEVMLQQTQVKTVIPYWERWMSRFPNVQSLAAGREEEVLKAWEGLGYYSRARNLQKAARTILSEHHGIFPRSPAEVLELPGVGRYTAGAICSIAFGMATPILDGNVARVLSRLFLIAGSPREHDVQNELWGISTALVEGSTDPSALNQGLMELGATICLPREPLCQRCPVKQRCPARLSGRVAEFPGRPPRALMRARQFAAFIFRHRDQVLVRKRAPGEVNGGLWEFPNVEVTPEADAAERARLLGLEKVKTIKHTITRNRITLHAFSGAAHGNAKRLAREFQAEWHPVVRLHEFPFSSAHARLRALVQEAHESRR